MIFLPFSFGFGGKKNKPRKCSSFKERTNEWFLCWFGARGICCLPYWPLSAPWRLSYALRYCNGIKMYQSKMRNLGKPNQRALEWILPIGFSYSFGTHTTFMLPSFFACYAHLESVPNAIEEKRRFFPILRSEISDSSVRYNIDGTVWKPQLHCTVQSVFD